MTTGLIVLLVMIAVVAIFAVVTWYVTIPATHAPATPATADAAVATPSPLRGFQFTTNSAPRMFQFYKHIVAPTYGATGFAPDAAFTPAL